MILCQVLVQSVESGMYQVHTPHFVVPNLVPMLQYVFKVSLCPPSLSIF